MLSNNAMLIKIFVILAVILQFAYVSYGQSFQLPRERPVIRVNVTATILSAIEVETLSNINFGRVEPGVNRVSINPRVDAGAGLMRLSGQPNSDVSISFIESRELFRTDGGTPLIFNFEISGNQDFDQFVSEPLTQENRQISLSQTGEYFFWIGGSMDLQGSSFGSYEGEFTIEIDYI
jgi:hypothetical protein